MPRELLKLVECEVDAGFSTDRDRERRTYEVYVGDFVKSYDTSANGSWHDRHEYEAKHGDAFNLQWAEILVISDQSYVGHWKNITGFYDFLELYMRATDFFEVVP